jgi:hypothetical protein
MSFTIAARSFQCCDVFSAFLSQMFQEDCWYVEYSSHFPLHGIISDLQFSFMNYFFSIMRR